MTTLYFMPEDHQAFEGTPAPDVQAVYDKLFALHTSLHRRIRDHNWDLHPHWDRTAIITSHSAACSTAISGLTLSYLRSREQAQLVERLTGRDRLTGVRNVEVNRHPVIEVRITREHLAVELVLSPTSWWDQRNFIGKLSIQRHRDTLRNILQRMNGEYYFGFWDGIHLSDAHLTNRQLLRGNILEEWMGTFSDGQDWLRVGAWYEAGDPALATDTILSELVQRMSALYQIYSFALWTSNNNFQSFYKGWGTTTTGRERSTRM